MNTKHRGLFVTGTDTGVGKTWISAGILAALRQRQLRAAGFKPIASGAIPTPDGLRNSDAERLLAEASVETEYELVNPYCFEPPIAPHIAAAERQVEISLSRIDAAYRTLTALADYLIVEGVGGWRVPIGPDINVSDLAIRLELPVVLVVGLRLGCINHARLSMEAMRNDGVAVAGWIATQVDSNYERTDGTLECLTQQLGEPFLAFVPWMVSFNAAAIAKCLDGAVARLLE